MQRAGQRIGVEEGQRHHDGGRERRHPDAVPQRGDERRRREVAGIVGEADEARHRRPGSSWTAASQAAARWRASRNATSADDGGAHDDRPRPAEPRGARQLPRRHASCAGLRAVVEDAQRLGRQRHRQRPGPRDAEVAHGVGGEVGAQASRSPPAWRRSVARQKAPRKSSSSRARRDGVGRSRSTPRMRTSSGRNPSLTRWPPRRAARASQASSSAPARTRPGPATTASKMFIAPTKSATKAVRGPGVDLGRAPHLLDAPAVHHHDAVGHGQRLLLVVRDHDRW